MWSVICKIWNRYSVDFNLDHVVLKTNYDITQRSFKKKQGDRKRHFKESCKASCKESIKAKLVTVNNEERTRQVQERNQTSARK